MTAKGGELFEVGAAVSSEAEKMRDGKDGDDGMFFKRPAFLTVSGQMHAEALACSMGRVYTFGPTFRAENSHTSRHLAEFWMIEPEIAFATMDDAIDVAEGTIQSTFQQVLEKNAEEVDFLECSRPWREKTTKRTKPPEKEILWC